MFPAEQSKPRKSRREMLIVFAKLAFAFILFALLVVGVYMLCDRFFDRSKNPKKN